MISIGARLIKSLPGAAGAAAYAFEINMMDFPNI
jgi:hypothetical protein